MSTPFEAARAAFVAGVAAFEAGELPRAETLFLDSLRLLPGRPSTLANLAAVRQRLGRPADALLALDQALAAAPNDAPAWYHRGQLLQILERPQEALAAYRRVTVLESTQGAAWSQCGSLLKDMGRLPEAAECFRKALAHGADAELNRYFLASVESALHNTGPDAASAGVAEATDAARTTEAAGAAEAGAALQSAPQSAPAHYVEALFDSYAEDFDKHLVGELGYRTPWLIAKLLLGEHPAATPGPANWPSALDLGCGTGLMGPLLAPHCTHLDGVDLSSQMLAKARALGNYRELVHAEVGQHLQATPERYDLVVAADVFVYIGELTPVFAGVQRVLRPGGQFAFSVEEAGERTERFELRASSRYAHREGYLRGLAAAHGLVVDAVQRTELRHEQRQPIGGLLICMTRH